MNSGQTAAATFGGAVLAESLIGGIGIGMLGTAVGIPAAAVVAAVGGTATAVKLIEEHKNGLPRLKFMADMDDKFILRKGDIDVIFSVSKCKQHCAYYYKTKHASQPKERVTLQQLRNVYSQMLRSGYTRVS